ncbi:MAG: hypothetical protein R3C05_31920 [Pirellulaceae bacterium]
MRAINYSPAGIALLVSLFITTRVHADPLLDQGLEKMAIEIKSFLDDERLPKQMIVGDFSGAPRLKASGGVEISRAIAQQLEKVGIVVSDDADLQLMGSFKLKEAKAQPHDDFESLALEIEATILDGEDEELAEVPISVFGSVALQIAGQTVEVPPKLPERQRQEKLVSQTKNPPTNIDQSRTRPSQDSPFGVEVLVRNGNRLDSRSPRLDSRGRSNVDLHLGEEYVVRLYNDASFEAAVTLTIDGVDMFIDAEDAPKDSRLIVYPGRHVDIPGWYITQTNSKAFEIGGYEESVAKRQGSSKSVGTISATFRACWDPNGPRPADEPGGNAKGGKATKQGRDISKNYVQLIRDFGEVRAVVSVRYDR